MWFLFVLDSVSEYCQVHLIQVWLHISTVQVEVRREVQDHVIFTMQY